MKLPEDLSQFTALVELIARLRGPEGCPWDKAQTHASLRETFLQECYEVLETLDEGEARKLCEELGDLLLHIVLQAQIAAERGEFQVGDVIEGISKKLVHRHPHVFGEQKVSGVAEIVHNWEALKQEERGGGASILDGIPGQLPALSTSQEIQHRVARVGFDWETDAGVVEKLAEEVNELRQEVDEERRGQEFGDLLFTLVNIGRRQGIDVETALRTANRKFTRRFQYMEEVCRRRGVTFSKLSFGEQNALWEEAKRAVRG